MRRILLLAGLVLAGAGVGAGTVLASGALGEEDPVEVISVPAAAPVAQPGEPGRRVVVEEGIARADADRLVRVALADVPGAAISVERDDGLFQVEVRDDHGRLHEVLIDDRFTVVGRDGDED